MKKWVLAVGLFGCGVLFFISGSFLGYLLSNTKGNEEPQVNTRRKPSKRLEPILGQVVEAQKVGLINRTRIPTPNAVYRAKQYKSQYIGSN